MPAEAGIQFENQMTRTGDISKSSIIEVSMSGSACLVRVQSRTILGRSRHGHDLTMVPEML